MRHDWMDGLRGLAIVAVVVLHAELVAGPVPAVAALDAALAPYRMPLLVCLSGMLLQRSLAKGWRRHLRGKAEAVLWPYVVWAGLDTAHVLLDAAVLGERVPWEWVPALAYAPHTYLWFLGHLFAYHLLATPLPAPARTLLGPVLVLAAGSVEGPLAHRFLLLAGWFLIGDALGRVVAPLLPAELGRWAARLPWGPLTAVGRHSLVYYATHLIVVVYAVRVLRLLGVADPVPLFACAVVVPLLVGRLLVSLRGRRPVDVLFRWPAVGSAADRTRRNGTRPHRTLTVGAR